MLRELTALRTLPLLLRFLALCKPLLLQQGEQLQLRQMDLQNQRIADLLDQFWSCRKSHAAGSIERLQNWNTAQQSLDGAKLLLKTAANQVRQVVDEIEIVTQREQR